MDEEQIEEVEEAQLRRKRKGLALEEIAAMVFWGKADLFAISRTFLLRSA